MLLSLLRPCVTEGSGARWCCIVGCPEFPAVLSKEDETTRPFGVISATFCLVVKMLGSWTIAEMIWDSISTEGR